MTLWIVVVEDREEGAFGMTVVEEADTEEEVLDITRAHMREAFEAAGEEVEYVIKAWKVDNLKPGLLSATGKS